MEPLHWLALAVTLLALTVPSALAFFALRLKAGLSITVQSPPAVLPERLMATLDALEAKLQPAQMPLDDAKLGRLVYEAVASAENTKLKGYDKFRVAREHIERRLKELNMVPPDPRTLALRIEGAVGVTKKKP